MSGQRYEYKMIEVADRYGLPGGYYQQCSDEGWRAIKMFRSRRGPDDIGFIIVYERPIKSDVTRNNARNNMNTAEWLRVRGTEWPGIGANDADLCRGFREAADEIDRLCAALREIAGLDDVRCDEAPTIARRALGFDDVHK